MQKRNNPIGIFDSGIGGLTVAKTITDILPNEDIVYFGDTAHTPWGDKSLSAIQNYSLKICDVLLQHQCKYIVIACHTASTAAFELVKKYVGNEAEVINVIDPVIEHIRFFFKDKKIGLIGTKQTVRSNMYAQRLHDFDPNIAFVSLATPLLVPLIEEGFVDNPVSHTIMSEYLSHPSLKDIEALILGCTHYPLMKHHIHGFYQNKVDIIDSADVTAKLLKIELEKAGLHKETLGSDRVFYVSDYTEFFALTAKRFFPGSIRLQHHPLETS